MNYNKINIKEGINLHIIPTNKFKTNLLSIFITTPLSRQTVTKNALIPTILRRGSNNLKTQEEISKYLEEMYGASFDCGIEKIGDNHVIKFYLETINDTYLPDNETILKASIETLIDIVFNPKIENEKFDKIYLDTEKENLRQIIEGKIDNKAVYSLNRCIEEMYKNKPYGLYKFGYAEDLEAIDEEKLYNTYKTLISESKIDIFISGKVEIKQVEDIIKQNNQIRKLNDRKPQYISSGQRPESKENINEVTESMQITQGKLVLGLEVQTNDLEEKYVALVYNAILGGGASSKLFQNVREKASLAYTAGSNYIKQKDNIFIRCGIEIKNYQKALQIIKQQLQDIQKGEFSEEELENAKTTIISTIKFIPDEQDTEITYYFGQELANTKISFEEYIDKINSITKEQIVKLAQDVAINTIYFLKD